MVLITTFLYVFLFSFYSLFNYIPQDLDLVEKFVVDKLDLDELDSDLVLD